VKLVKYWSVLGKYSKMSKLGEAVQQELTGMEMRM
jgi:hypothetical protein